MEVDHPFVKVIFKTLLLAASLSMAAIAAPVLSTQQCDGMPHPESGQPMPCFPPKPTLPDPNSGADWRLAEQQRQQQQQQQAEEAAARERARIHRCELQAQHDYEECKRNTPNGYCPLKPCY